VDIDKETVMYYVYAFKPQIDYAAVNAVSVQATSDERFPSKKQYDYLAEKADVTKMNTQQQLDYIQSVANMII
jgi:hypothetical protein